MYLDVKPVVQGDMSWLHTLTGDRDYAPEKPSSCWHTVLHGVTGKLGMIDVVAHDSDPEAVIEAMWPDNPLMTAVTEFFNDPDHAVEMENLVLEPETVEVTVQQQAASSTEGARNSRFRANAGATGAKRQKAAGAAARTEVQWKKPELRGMLKDFKGVRSGVDSSKAGWLKTKSSKARLIFLPNIPPFAMEHLTEALCGNTKLAALLAICVLHQDMRIVGMLCDQCEAIPRGLLEAPSISATNQAAIDEFNQTMAEDRELKIRHSIVKLEKGVPPSGFNGKSARLLLNNWAKNPPLQGLQTFRRTGAYPSTYFCALYKLIATVEPNAAILPKLPEIADCVRHYALAALIHRKRVPAATDYDEYEKHSVWFAAKWRAQGFALKGYGWHCWATNATLFRKFQTLAIYDQSPVEGNNERINAFSRKIPKSTGAAYKLSDWAQGEEHIKAVAEDRKRRQKSTSRAILEMCEAATWDAEYCLGPGKGKLKERTSFTINSTLVEIDAAIKAGNVRDWKTVFVPITGAYMVIETLKSVRGSRCRRNADFSVEAQRRRADGAFAEYEQYYEGLPLIVLDEPVLTTEQTPQWLEENDKGSAERYRITSRLERKKAWREHIGTSVNDRWYSNAVRADRDEAKAVAAEKAKAAAAAAAAAAAQPGEEPEATEDELDKEPRAKKRRVHWAKSRGGERPPTGAVAAGLLLIDVYRYGETTVVFILEQLVLAAFLRRGIMTALLLKAMERFDEGAFVDLIVRSKATQQAAARANNKAPGFKRTPLAERLPPPFKVKPHPQSEIYLRTTVGELCEKLREKLDEKPAPPSLTLIERKDFRPHGFAFERTFTKAIGAQHCCAQGNGTRVGDLIPRTLRVDDVSEPTQGEEVHDPVEGTCEPLVLLAFM